MATPPATIAPYSEVTTLTYDLPGGAPAVQDIAPTRITIRYSQHELFAIPRTIEVDIKGRILVDGQLSALSRTINYRRNEQLPTWAAILVHDNLPAWWTA